MTPSEQMHALRVKMAELRAEQRRHKEIMAQREARTAVGGKNAEERKNALTISLSEDRTYCDSWQANEDITHDLERLEADLDQLRDERREREWGIRLRLVEALERRGIPSEQTGDDNGFDDVADHTLNSRALMLTDDFPF